jgi:hypothetical protein
MMPALYTARQDGVNCSRSMEQLDERRCAYLEMVI